MKGAPLKILIIALISVIITTMLYYTFYIQEPVSNDIDYSEYAVLNFESYDEFNTYLQSSSSSNSENNLYYTLEDPSIPRVNEGGTQDFDEGASNKENSDYSETNIQELGVDEPDFVKTDGTYLYVISNQKLYIIYAYPTENAEIISTILFNESDNPKNFFINDDKLSVITQSYLYRTYYDFDDEIQDVDELMGYSDSTSSIGENSDENLSKSSLVYDEKWEDTTSTHIFIYNISNKNKPERIRDIQMDGYYTNARMIEEYVYVITTQYIYETIVSNEENSMYIPKIRVDGNVENIGLSDIYYFDSPDSLNTLTHIISINIQDETEKVNAEVFMFGSSSTIYISPNSIYISTVFNNYDYASMYDTIQEYVLPLLPVEAINELNAIDTLSLADYQKYTVSEWIMQKYIENMDEEEKQTIAKSFITQYEKTIIHKINMVRGDISYSFQGTVPGYINNQFSMSEYNGDLRIATTVNGWMMRTYISTIDSYSNVYVLDESLEIIGKIEDIAKGEDIYSVRFDEHTCYLVTFKQIDPFFVIDLSNPLNPIILGELKIPGYSTYLHPYDENHVIGIGQEENNVKVSLFNVEDVSNPKELSTYTIQKENEDYFWSYSTALYEHKAFLFSKQKHLLSIPVSIEYKESAYIFNISENGIKLRGIITHESETNKSESDDPWEDIYWKEDYRYSIQRSLYIEEVIYTFSDAMIKMNDLSTLDELNYLHLF